MRRTTTCTACRHDVPAGRWCNWCGARLAAPVLERARRRVPVGPAAVGVVALAAVGVMAGAASTAGGGDGEARARPPSAVVLAEDAPAPPPPSSRPGRDRAVPPGGPPAERVDVICSDLRVRSVPVTEIATDVPGELVELANGTCVVMGPEGAVAP